jgi:hypothetical protein
MRKSLQKGAGNYQGITMLSLASIRRCLPSTSTTVLIALSALLAGGVIQVRSWLAAHDAAIHLAATLEAQEQLVAQANQRQRERDNSLAKTISSIAQAKRRVDTPAKAAAAIPDVLPPLPAPLHLQLPAPTLQEPQPPALPPPAVATIPQVDLKPLYDYAQDCHACQASLAVADDNLEDEKAKLDAVTAERDAAVRASKGGGFWSRLRHNAKWFALGAATGALAAAASR